MLVKLISATDKETNEQREMAIDAVGRTGELVVFGNDKTEDGDMFIFLHDDRYLRTSRGKETRDDNIITISTYNSIYVFEVLEDYGCESVAEDAINKVE